MSARPLFVYGTLCDPDVRRLVLGRAVAPAAAQPAVAPEHRVVVFPGRSYPALRREAGKFAQGTLLTELSGTELALLDLFEGVEYSRGPIEIIVSGRAVAADVYWPVPGIPADAEDWRLADWAKRHKTAFLSAEADAIAQFRQRLSPR